MVALMRGVPARAPWRRAPWGLHSVRLTAAGMRVYQKSSGY